MSTFDPQVRNDPVWDGIAVGGIGPLTEHEFETWVLAEPDRRAEWVAGEVMMMSPVNYDHVSLNSWLGRVMGIFAEERKLGEVLGPEFMVRFPQQQRRRIPDLLFVSNARRELIRPTYLDGAPDLAVEIVSPEDPDRDWRVKFGEYRSAGIREYWIIDPAKKTITAFRLNDRGDYEPLREANGRIESIVLTGFYLRSQWLWGSPRPSILNVLRELGVEEASS